GREHDRVRGVVDDEVDARQVLERADVAALTPDDPTLEAAGRELDHGHGRPGRVTRRDPLERAGHASASAPPSAPARLPLPLPNATGELVAHEVLRALEQLLSRRLRGEAGDPFQGDDLLALRLPELLLEGLDVHLAVAEPLLAPDELVQLLVDLLLF